jgi:tyrosinase
MALYEVCLPVLKIGVNGLHRSQQILYSHIVAVVNEFPAGPTRSRYALAAMSWRHPYWDWAAEPSDGNSVLPTSITSKTVTVTLPNGTSTIDNPLYAYRFHQVSQEDFYYDPVRLFDHFDCQNAHD